MKKYLSIMLVLLAVVGCSQLQQVGNRYVLTELELAKLDYVLISNDYALARDLVRQQRANGLLDDAAWTRFDAVQQEIRDLSVELIGLRGSWDTTQIKPAQWDERIDLLRSKVEEVGGMIQ